jgi:hypothetical protein
MMYKLILISVFLFTDLLAVGFQHGTFRSQSTQGPPWRGTSSIIREEFDITVYPDYLDVTLDWEFDVGGAPPDTFKNALEIVGNLNLEAGSVVIGMLLWNGDEILKAKLKPIGVAREQYEEVVDRDSPAPVKPRDPVIFENSGWRQDNYDISIFPVAWGGTRKLRFRYLVPSKIQNGETVMGYPHPFSRNATVHIKSSDGMKGFRLVPRYRYSASTTNVLTQAGNKSDNREIEYFDPSGTGFVAPVLEGNSGASKLYLGTFHAPGLKGQMAHFKMGLPETLFKKLKSEIVIIWRWNHPEFLRKYGYMIINQSKKLIEFLDNLDSANQRCAMIIDIMGEENIEFKMSGKGEKNFRDLRAYLLDLTGRKSIKPPPGPEPEYTEEERNSLIAESIREFNEAIEKALSYFTGEETVLKKLVFLTAGPGWVKSDKSLIPDGIDDRIIITSLNESRGEDYWPGINIHEFILRNRPNLNLTGEITNGSRSVFIKPVELAPFYMPGRKGFTSTNLKLYSDRPLEKTIRWQIIHNRKVIWEFKETPDIIPMKEGLQYARLLGASQNLFPLAATMPSSMAAALGFVDKEYALLALEEDVMDEELQKRYRGDGVPGLNPEDIYPAVSEPDSIPLEQRLSENKPGPENMSPATITHRQNGFLNGISVFIKNGRLIIEINPEYYRDNNGLHITLYDLNGRIIKQWNYSEIAGIKGISWSPYNAGLNAGIFMLRINTGTANISRRVLIK